MRSRDFGEATGKLSVKVSEIDTRCTGFGSHDDIALHRKHIFISSCEHTKSTLHTITRYSVTNSLADGKSHTSHDIRRCLNITGIVMHHKVHDDIRIRHLEATLSTAMKSRWLFSRFTRLRHLPQSGGQRLTSLVTAAVDHRAAGTGAHAHAETMLHRATAVVGLECPLHSYAPGFCHANARLS